MASEILKSRVHRGLTPSLSFFRDRKGVKVDLVVELGGSLLAVETKSGQTVASDFFAGLRVFESLVESSRRRRNLRSFVVYGGSESQQRAAGRVVPWSALDQCQWWEPSETGS